MSRRSPKGHEIFGAIFVHKGRLHPNLSAGKAGFYFRGAGAYRRDMFGFFNINKPPGPTSHDIVNQLRRRVGKGVKLGHAGTLDPFAEGVLVLCVGPGTRLAEYVQAYCKRYAAEVTLGATSTTDDPEGQISEVAGASAPSLEAVKNALGAFVGQIQQVPPAHSAVHVEGRRAYELARDGKTPRISPRTVTIHTIELLSYDYPRLDIDVTCGAGTYIRALARDIGEALHSGAYCSALRRTEVGPFRAEQAKAPDELDPQRHLLSPLMALESMEKIKLPADQIRRLTLGQAVQLTEPRDAHELAVLDERGHLTAITSGSSDGLALQPIKVFAN